MSNHLVSVVTSGFLKSHFENSSNGSLSNCKRKKIIEYFDTNLNKFCVYFARESVEIGYIEISEFCLKLPKIYTDQLLL